MQTDAPSPFAASLQFGFVMDWLYGDDTPRAEQRAALLSIDRSLLDEVMGGEGSDDITLEAIEQTLAERRGTAPGRRARTDDELAHLLDRAGDLTRDEVAIANRDGRRRCARRSVHRAAGESPRDRDPARRRRDEGMAIHSDRDLPSLHLRFRRRSDLARVTGGTGLEERGASELVPDVLRQPAINASVARREILARFLTQSGPVTIAEIHDRYGWSADWIESRLAEWERTGKLIRGKFRREVQDFEWCSRRVVEIGRRRALAALRKQIEAVELPHFAAFMQRWQHLDERDRLDGLTGTQTAVRQLYGIARPPLAWDRDYLQARVVGTIRRRSRSSPRVASRCGRGRGTTISDTGAIPLARVRFFERGTGALWLSGKREAGSGKREEESPYSATTRKRFRQRLPRRVLRSLEIFRRSPA